MSNTAPISIPEMLHRGMRAFADLSQRDLHEKLEEAVTADARRFDRILDVPVITLLPGMKLCSPNGRVENHVKTVITYDKGEHESACDRTHIHIVGMPNPEQPSKVNKMCYHVGDIVKVLNANDGEN